MLVAQKNPRVLLVCKSSIHRKGERGLTNQEAPLDSISILIRDWETDFEVLNHQGGSAFFVTLETFIVNQYMTKGVTKAYRIRDEIRVQMLDATRDKIHDHMRGPIVQHN